VPIAESLGAAATWTAAGSLAGAASGPQFIARNTTQVKIAVNAKNEALITYRTGWPAQANPGV
jgi:hypothetical protein